MRVVLVMALVLALAAPASAQSPIAGGGSFNSAPVLAPGKYKDTLRGGEQLFYAVTLKPGIYTFSSSARPALKKTFRVT